MENKGRKGDDRTLSRRNFLKAVGLGSASLALGGLEPGASFGQGQDRYMFASAYEQNSADPAGHMDVGRSPTRMNFYDGLMRWRDNPPQLTPNIALSYEVSKDALKWTFKLRKDALFHDGSKVAAEDVVYSIERLLSLNTGAAGIFAPILDKGSTKALDQSTVEFNLKKRFSPFPGLTHFLDILNKGVLQKHETSGDWGSRWLSGTGTVLGKDGVGTGSYTTEMYNPAVGFDGAKFKDHFLGWEKPHMEKVGFRSMHDMASRILALMKGDFHGEAGYMPYDQLQKVKADAKMKVVEQRSARLFYAYLHCQKPPTSDVHFRRAICYAFDYDNWIKNIQHGMVERNIGPVPNTMWGSLDPKKEWGFTYDLDKAKDELKQCKVDWKKYLPIEQVPQLGVFMNMEAAQFLQACLNKIGITTAITPKSWPTCTEITRKQETSPTIWWTWRSTYYPDPNNWIGEMYDSDKWGTWGASSWYKNPKVDDLLRKAVSIVDQEERAKLYIEAGRILVPEAPGLFIHNEMWTGPFSKRVQGIRFCPVGDANEWRWLYFG
jgi:peptide/nickel transport system substrate-binding protein